MKMRRGSIAPLASKSESEGIFPQHVLQSPILVTDQLGAAEVTTIDCPVDARLRNLIKGNDGTAGDNRASLVNDGAQVVLVIRAIPGKSDGHEEVLLVVADEVQNEGIVLSLSLSEASAELLNEDDSRLRASQHNNLI